MFCLVILLVFSGSAVSFTLGLELMAFPGTTNFGILGMKRGRGLINKSKNILRSQASNRLGRIRTMHSRKEIDVNRKKCNGPHVFLTQTKILRCCRTYQARGDQRVVYRREKETQKRD